MSGRKSGYQELRRSAIAGLSAVAIVGAILGLVLWLAPSPPAEREKRLAPAERTSLPSPGPGRADTGPQAAKQGPPDVGDLADAGRNEAGDAKSVPPPAPPVAEQRVDVMKAKSRPALEILSELKRRPASGSTGEARRRADLIGELYRESPSNRQLPTLLVERWLTLRGDPAVELERAEAMARKRGDPIGSSAAYVAARLAIEDPAVDWQSARKAIDDFAAHSRGKSPLLAEVLVKLAEEKTELPQDRRAIYLSIVEGFPGTLAAQAAETKLAMLDFQRFEAVVDPKEAANDPRIGRSFEFAFQDAVSGEPVTSAGLRGRVVVVDFWATWCPPCVESMPRMKESYQKYAPRGVVFIGVSLDKPDREGREKLLNFVAANEIPWAQFHEANGELSKAWNVSSIPTVFVLDQEGRIATTRARLDEVIPRLIGDTDGRAPPTGSRVKTSRKPKPGK